MRALMLAAGTGTRLTGAGDEGLPKSLLRFDGQSLLERHIEILGSLGVDHLTLVVGYRSQDIEAEIKRLAVGEFVSTLFNEQFRRGSVVSFWQARSELMSGNDILFMDADVLYDPAVLEALVLQSSQNSFLFDRDFEEGDEPVKICLKDGYPIEFRKSVDVAFDSIGEWLGFLRLSPEMSAKAAHCAQGYVDRNDIDKPVEEVFRDLLLAEPKGQFHVTDVTGHPWIEIDFPEDVIKAETVILPRIMSGRQQTRL